MIADFASMVAGIEIYFFGERRAMASNRWHERLNSEGRALLKRYKHDPWDELFKKWQRYVWTVVGLASRGWPIDSSNFATPFWNTASLAFAELLKQPEADRKPVTVIERIAKDEARNGLRPMGASPELEDEPDDYMPDDKVEADETQQIVNDVLNTMPKDERDPVIWRYLQGRSYVEIAKTLKVGREAANRKVLRALQEIRRRLRLRGVELPVYMIAAGLALTSEMPAAEARRTAFQEALPEILNGSPVPEAALIPVEQTFAIQSAASQLSTAAAPLRWIAACIVLSAAGGAGWWGYNLWDQSSSAPPPVVTAFLFPAKPQPGQVAVVALGAPPIDAEFVWVPAGAETSGHWMLRAEVTQRLWRALGVTIPGVPDPTNPSQWPGDTLPVETLKVEHAEAALDRLSKQLRVRFRLPNRAEWIHAASAAGREPDELTPADLLEQAWFEANSGNQTHPVDDPSKKPNGLGLYGMRGNVFELCRDGDKLTIRGGCWAYPAAATSLQLDYDWPMRNPDGTVSFDARDGVGFRFLHVPGEQ